MSAAHRIWFPQVPFIPVPTELQGKGVSNLTQPRPKAPEPLPTPAITQPARQTTEQPEPAYLQNTQGQHLGHPLPATTDLDIVDALYVIENAEEERVEEFLADNRDIARLLASLSIAIDRIFGLACVKTLRVLQDEEGTETLLCSIATQNNLAGARQQLRVFDQEWWLAKVPALIGRLTIDFDLL